MDLRLFCEKVGVSADRLTRLDRLLQGYVERCDLAGVSAAVYRADQCVYWQVFGMQDIEAAKPLQPDTIFRIASMTKPVTCVAAMLLYEEGHFNLNTPVSKFIPAFKEAQVFAGYQNGEPVYEPLKHELTMRHLFTHTSGLSYGWNPEDPVDRLYQEAGKRMEQAGIPPTMENIVNNLTQLPLAFQPGTHWRYSLSIDVIGRIVEIISGKPLDSFFKERIFEPLGMTDTDFFVPPEKEHRLAALYGHQPNEAGLKRLEDQTPRQRPLTLWGGGGLVSTLGDYSRFTRMLTNGGILDGVRLLSPHTVRLFTLNQAPEAALPYGFVENDLYHAGYGYSLGTRVLMDVARSGLAGSVGEFGWDGAYSTYFWVDRAEALCGVLMTQHAPNAYYPIHPQFKQIVYQALLN